MSRKDAKMWRGITSISLSVSIALTGLTSIANEWRSVIDQLFGTSSTVTTNDSKYVSDYSSTDELIEAHKTLGEQVGEEGVVLLKNENQVLPLSSDTKKVTVLGMGGYYPFLGGTMGSTVSGDETVDLISALENGGYEVNPTMTDIYTTLGEVVTGESQGWTGTTPIYGNRPANFANPYEPSEPAMSVYEQSTANGGAGANADYAESFKDYNDAAIVVISRPGAEGSDYYPENGIDEAKYGTDTALSLATNEKALIETAKANFENVIVMINSGSTMEVEELKQDPEIDSLMYVGFPGKYGFDGVVNVVSGEASPSGHLTDTYAVDSTMSPAVQNFGKIAIEDLSPIVSTDSLMGTLDATSPLGSFGGDASLSADHYLIEAEGIYVGYKYYETRYYDTIVDAGNASSSVGASNGNSEWDYANEVSYTFGYGLSYTDFEQTIKDVKVNDDNTVSATVSVKNTGDVAGKDVVQLYVQTPYTDYDKENNVEKSAIEFIGMEKTDTLQPSEEAEVEVVVDMKYIASWDSTAKDGKGGYILDGGDYYFTVGNGAHEAVNNVLETQGYSVDGDSNLVSVVSIGKDGEVDEETFAYSENGTEVVNQLADADINYYKPDYATYLSRTDWEGTFPKTYDDLTIDGDKVDEWVQHLTNEDYMINENGEVNTEGSEGTLMLSDLAGEDNIDDPRWEELVNQIPVDTLFAKIVKGGSASDVIEEVGSPLVYQNDGPNGFTGTLNGRGLNTDDANGEYSMATMANEVLLASTFNKDILNSWGQLVGNDGLWSGNWLIWGAAANIHRTPYSGRNFEYYSEDAMLSNYMAAEVVSGAIEYGVIMAPKHFAFNDQETQRSGVAPYMTEQKAREGDLRAFQGTVEEAGALGMMTSFSRIGATAVNGSDELLNNILRDEWGFKGILSTDMVNNTGYFRPEAAIMSGVTMLADFSTGETMTEVEESWPYFTMDLAGNDEVLVDAARDAMKYQMYAFAHSAAQNVKTEVVTPWWETAINVGKYLGLIVGLLSLGLYVNTVARSNRGKKEEY